MRSFGAALLTALLFAGPTSAFLLRNAAGGDGSASPPSYVGPCDVTASPCAEAYSLARAMTNSYSGALFQLERQSDNATLDIPQTSQHTADLSGVWMFCGSSPTQCWYSKIYPQINVGAANNALVPQLAGAPLGYCIGGGVMPPYPYNCGAPFWIDPFTGTPMVSTILQAAYTTPSQSGQNLVGINVNTFEGTVVWIGRNEQGTTRSGYFGLNCPDTYAPCTGTSFYGNMITVGNQWGNTFTAPVVCTSATTFCIFVDYNGGGWNQVDYGNTPGRVVLEDKLVATPMSSNHLIVNGVDKLTSTPPSQATYSGGLYNGAIVASFGQVDHSDGLFQEGIVFNTAISTGDDTAIANNVSAFYAAQSPAACSGVADHNYFIQSHKNYLETTPISSTRGAWALYQMGAAQTGPIVQLRDVTTLATDIFGPSSSGCGLGLGVSSGLSAPAFCAMHGCSVATLYNQAWFSTTSRANLRDPLLNLTAALTGAEPTVTFNGLNGRPTMHFSGTQKLCTGTWGVGGLNTPPMERPWSLMAVARRTGSTSAIQALISVNPSSTPGQGFIGFDAVSGGVIGAVGGIVAGTKTQGTGLIEGQWHSIDIDDLDLAGTPAVTASGSIWGDGAALALET